MEHIEKALHSIIKYNENREWMHTPFTIGNNVYSTDAHSIIRVPKETVGLFDECKKEGNAKVVLNLFDFTPQKILTINVQDLKDALGEIPLVDECLNVDAEGKCKECSGSGEVEWEYEGHYNDFDCPICDGNGTLTESQKHKTGRKVKAEGYYIDFNYNRIRTCMIEELINIAWLLKVDEIELINQIAPNKAIVFQVGIAQIVMMPVLITDEQNVLKSFTQLSEKEVEKN